MEYQNPHSKIARLADSGFRSTSLDDAWKMKTNGSIGEEGSPPIGLGLELGRGPGYGHRLNCPPKSSGSFTFLQLQELEHQALIFKYMEAGQPVPYHLILPIWKSVASSLGGLNGGLYPRYPSFCSPMYLDYKNSMDPEPGRCRRTDGKKWRCSKEAVPDQKYCERHMHRGRQRSRKHVEVSQLSRATSTTTATTNNTNRDFLNSSTNLSISLPFSSTTSNSNVSPTLGFSPKSVLQGDTQKIEPSL
ncbi:hypothetical protein L1049_007209 [Liquidambar formosana]|uniref:Growth-regulating factor n=1 Tax=Liquidambar formosana TaxID=63359 RepID=A0AAP0RGX9_LIQFO